MYLLHQSIPIVARRQRAWGTSKSQGETKYQNLHIVISNNNYEYTSLVQFDSGSSSKTKTQEWQFRKKVPCLPCRENVLASKIYCGLKLRYYPQSKPSLTLSLSLHLLLFHFWIHVHGSHKSPLPFPLNCTIVKMVPLLGYPKPTIL